jgi:hypothetical protein
MIAKYLNSDECGPLHIFFHYEFDYGCLTKINITTRKRANKREKK